MKKQKDELCEQSFGQRNPATVRAEDFHVMTPAEAEARNKSGLNFNGQCGDTQKEYRELEGQIEHGSESQAPNYVDLYMARENADTVGKAVDKPAKKGR